MSRRNGQLSDTTAVRFTPSGQANRFKFWLSSSPPGGGYKWGTIMSGATWTIKQSGQSFDGGIRSNALVFLRSECSAAANCARSQGKYLASSNPIGFASKKASVAWRLVYSGVLKSGALVYLYGVKQNQYLSSATAEGATWTWSGKNAALAWRLYWEGDLRSSTLVHLYGVAQRKFMHSNQDLRAGGRASWGGRSNLHAWRLEW